MSDWPQIAIVLYTFDRIEAAEPTLRAVLQLAQYSGPIHLHIADDGSPEGYREELERIAHAIPAADVVTVSNSERGGYGKSMNVSSQFVHDSNFAVLSLEDDWLLTRELDLDPLVRTLQETDIRCIRMGYLGGTKPIRGETVETPAGLMLKLDPQSEEHHIFAGHARLESVAFRQSVGEWPEGLRAGETEFEVCKRPASRYGVAWPMELVKPSGDLFLHTGERSYNQTVPEGVHA